MVLSAFGTQETQYFFALTPERILDALEAALGVRCTGRTLAHASMENRVYECEIEAEEADRKQDPYAQKLIAKFYRPGRWSREQIQEEHDYLFALEKEEIPVVAPKRFLNGESIGCLADSNILFAIFPKIGGRSPEELNPENMAQIGRLLARMHNVGALHKGKHRVKLRPELFFQHNLQYLLDEQVLPPSMRKPFQDLIHRMSETLKPLYQNVELIQIHGDCHLGNVLQKDGQFFWVDFDDSMLGPAVQDLWLMMPGRDRYALHLMQTLLSAYEEMRPFPHESLNLIEGLRAMRMFHFAAWIAHRRDDPAFQRAFPDFGQERYWQELYRDLCDQELWISKTHYWSDRIYDLR